MRIVQLTPGSGGSFYCENCLRDAAMVRAMRRLGHDVLMVPMYLPLQADDDMQVSNAPMFFGGVNVYLQQKSVFFRRSPRWIDRLFDSAALLRWVGRRAAMVDAAELCETTISMLRGEEGHQAKELERLVEWLRHAENRPDIVCLSNVLLAGLARQIKERLQVPVACLLQDEDEFIDKLGPGHMDRAWRMVAERARDVDVFVAVSRYYAKAMQERLGFLGDDRIRVVHTGVAVDEYAGSEAQAAAHVAAPTIGYLSRMCHEKGLDKLVDAFVGLKDNPKLRDAKLRMMGGQSGEDAAFIGGLRQKLDSAGVLGDAEFMTDFRQADRLSFLKSLSVLSVPERRKPACALYVLESLAAGVPVVEPAAGVLGELLEETGGGILYDPADGGALASALERLLLDETGAAELGRRGRDAVRAKFSVERSAEKMVRVYQETVGRYRRGEHA